MGDEQGTTALVEEKKAAPTSPAGQWGVGATRVDKGLQRAGDVLWRHLKRRPYLGVGMAAAAGLGVASVFGAAELAIGIAFGYAAYQVLTADVPPSEAVRRALAVEKAI